MNDKLQSGSALVKVLITVVAVCFVASAAWLYYANNWATPEADQPSKNDAPTSQPQTNNNLRDLSDSTLGIKFSYPKTWITLKCEGRDNALYIAADERGLGMQNGESILCGGGTDFAPPGSFHLMDKGMKYEGEAIAQEITIDGVKALKYFDVEDGEGLREEGFETTQYFIDRPNGVLVITYSEWPTSSEGQETASGSKAEFTTLVESSLKFL